MKTKVLLQLALCFFSFQTLAGTVTKSHSYGSPLTVDGTADYGVSLVGLTFTSGVDFPVTDEINSVTVDITFHKTDGSCGSPAAGYAYHGETTYRLDGPMGTNVILAQDDTWTGGADVSTVTVTFSPFAGATPSGAPSSGTFLPNGGDLNAFVGASPFGTWTLRAGDDAGLDPLCIYSYSITINTYDPLPIELDKFTATHIPEDKVVELFWRTKSERNNAYFTIERSLDGALWSNVAEQNGAGNSTILLEYYAYDLNPQDGTSYYRLKQTDFNGDYTYSAIETITIHSSYNVTVQQDKCVCIAGLQGNEKLNLFTVSGQLLQSVNSLEACETLQVQSPGVYILVVEGLHQTETIKVQIF